MGGWKTDDDNMFENITDEVMEGDIVIENLALLRQDRILTAEDASVRSFAVSDGGRSAQSSAVSVESGDGSTSAASQGGGIGRGS